VVKQPTTVMHSGAVVVRPEGRLTFGMAPELRRQLRSLIDSGNTRVVVDLSRVESTDSSGLAVLIDALKAARRHGGDLRIAVANERVRASLELTNLSQVLKCYDTADEAFDEAV
jgi:anti-sigma B factor antagonist